MRPLKEPVNGLLRRAITELLQSPLLAEIIGISINAYGSSVSERIEDIQTNASSTAQIHFPKNAQKQFRFRKNGLSFLGYGTKWGYPWPAWSRFRCGGKHEALFGFQKWLCVSFA